MNNKKTVVLGASPNPTRYSYMACHMLNDHSYAFVPVSIKHGEIAGEDILDIRNSPEISEVHTLTMYVGKPNQLEYYNYFLSLSPKRVIFNPGSENNELSKLFRQAEIEVVEACTLVMLRTGQF